MNHKLLLHNKTRSQYEALLSRTPHGILITGSTGSGKETLSLTFAANLLGRTVEQLAQYAYFLRLNPEGESISIEEIRGLQQFLKLKVPSSQQGMITRVLVIDRAERMRAEAQNALLKTLEEPPADTCIVMTASSTEVVLSTIASRTTELVVLPVSEQAALDYFKEKGMKASDVIKQYALSQGQAGLLSSLLQGESHELIEKVEQAKQLLSQPVAKRLLQTDEFAKDKQQARLLLNAMGRICHAALAAAAKQQKTNTARRWHERQAAVVQASTDFVYNPNTKLLLDDLFLKL